MYNTFLQTTPDMAQVHGGDVHSRPEVHLRGEDETHGEGLLDNSSLLEFGHGNHAVLRG